MKDHQHHNYFEFSQSSLKTVQILARSSFCHKSVLTQDIVRKKSSFTMIWSFAQVRLLGFFFVTQVLLVFGDMVTDLIFGFKVLILFSENKVEIYFHFSIATFICILLPSLPALIGLLWSLARNRGKISKIMLREFFF